MAPAGPPMPPGQMPPDWSKTPLVPPPSGIPNFINPPSRSPMAIAWSSVFLALMIPTVLLRFYARSRIATGIGKDDWAALIGAIFTAGFTIYSIVLFKLPGLGPHMYDIPGEVFMNSAFSMRMLWTEILYCPPAYFIKLSIFLLYRRVFTTPGGRLKYFLNYGLALTTMMYLVLLILHFSFCVHDQSLLSGGDCPTKGGQVAWAQSAVNIATDVYLLAIPPIIISRLQMSQKNKIGVAGIFLVGVGATIASIVALSQRVVAIRGAPDISWTVIPAAVATIAELNLGVICSCLPALSVLFRQSRSPAPGSKSSGSRFGWSFQHLMSRTFRSQTRIHSSDGNSASKKTDPSFDIHVDTVHLVSVPSDKGSTQHSTFPHPQRH